MPKIDFISGKTNIQTFKKPATASPDLFKSTLTQAIETQAPAADAVPGVPPLEEIRSLTCCHDTVPGADASILGKAEQLLDLLDRYSAQLNDPRQTLKDIAPLIDSIRNHADELVNASGSGLTSNDRLQEFVRDCSLTATMEWHRFNRGDYV